MNLFPVLAVVAVLVLCGYLFSRRRFRASQAASDRCAACESDALVALAPGAYRCTACGHEGGPGWAAHHDRARVGEFARLDPRARHESIRRDLQHAHDLLVAATGELDEAATFGPELALQLVAGKTPFVDDSELPDIERLTLDAVERLAAARRAIDDACLKVSSGATLAREPIVLERIAWPDDATASVHARVGPASTAAAAMLEMVDAQLRLHFGGLASSETSEAPESDLTEAVADIEALHRDLSGRV